MKNNLWFAVIRNRPGGVDETAHEMSSFQCSE